MLAGGSFEPFVKDVQRLGLNGRVIVRENVNEIEDYLQAADLGIVHVRDGELLLEHP